MARRQRLSITVLGHACLVDVDASPRILVDPGSGTLDRLEQTCLDLSSIEQILLTRLHIDSTGDLPAVLTHLYRSDRNRPIALTGPTGEPGAVEFVRLLFGSDGAWRYLNEFTGFDVIARETPSATSNLAAYSTPVEAILEELDVSLKDFKGDQELCALHYGRSPLVSAGVSDILVNVSRVATSK
jgi:ribonuclease BN (tRNA processing enzyme)